MPKITHEGPNLYRAAILLKWGETESWIWTGRNQMQTNTNEEPLTLEFNQKTFYFYATGIEKSKDTKTWDKAWKNYQDFLGVPEQEKMIEKFSQSINHNSWKLKTILLRLKLKVLNHISKELTSEYNTSLLTSDISFASNPIDFEEEVNYLHKWVTTHTIKLKTLNYRIYNYDKAIKHRKNTTKRINQEIKDLEIEISTLFDTSNELIQKNESLSKELITDIQSPTKKLKTSKEENIEVNFKLAQEFINEEEKQILDELDFDCYF